MPWKSSDASSHKKGLTSSQASKWAKIANHVLKTCMKDKGKNCEAMAIKIANDKCTQTKRMVK